MDKAIENIKKAIEERTSAYKGLTIDQILSLTTAIKNIYDAESVKNKLEGSDIFMSVLKDVGEVKNSDKMYGCSDEEIIGFCD